MTTKTLTINSFEVTLTFHKEASRGGRTKLIAPEKILELFKSIDIHFPKGRIRLWALKKDPSYKFRLNGAVEVEVELH